jgi:hypothetical protein
MKVKCTSKRRFKKILQQMISKAAFKTNSKEWHYYAASNFDCGIKTFKGYEVNFVPVGYLGMKANYIYLTQKLDVYENNVY